MKLRFAPHSSSVHSCRLTIILHRITPNLLWVPLHQPQPTWDIPSTKPCPNRTSCRYRTCWRYRTSWRIPVPTLCELLYGAVSGTRTRMTEEPRRLWRYSDSLIETLAAPPTQSGFFVSSFSPLSGKPLSGLSGSSLCPVTKDTPSSPRTWPPQTMWEHPITP